MTVNLGLLIVAGALSASGVYLLMERSLIRMLFGLLLVGNGINLLIVTLASSPGNPPIRGRGSNGHTADADPLAQGMVLTAIVITMGIAAFVLALTYRLFVINRRAAEEPSSDVEPTSTEGLDDDLQDDPEDVKIATGSLKNFPDRDRSDDPNTGADTVAGDFFDDQGNPMTVEEFEAAHTGVIETDLMPEDAELLLHLSDDDDDLPSSHTESARSDLAKLSDGDEAPPSDSPDGKHEGGDR
ncbi:Na(+)/H(+) antiporter subunit C [Gordonia zhaorongruii]|uniref:Na(+)/H(+) antiporter subunit C n=1 Tax=Gordonia zhaorongruii TaxID=2597659 RepID=UPI00104A672B|nr:Na(+)/H(+) antiporter subunit C [Gordonia zhaorongruii]